MRDKGNSGSCLHNCLIKAKQQDIDSGRSLFEEVNNEIICRLDGYAIVPVDEYNRLCEASKGSCTT